MIQEYQVFFALMGRTLHVFPSYGLFAELIKERVFSESPLDIDDDMYQQGMTLLSSFDAKLSGVLSDDCYHDLLADNTRLFVGEQEMICTPWESVYFNTERQLFQKQTMQVRSWYRRYDLQITKLHHEPDDHIGLELEFVAHLLGLADASVTGNGAEILKDVRRFIEEHPLLWIDKWSARVFDHAHTDFYKGLALVLPPALHSLVGRLP
jgi:TorA maturation chaperone TorD